MDGGVASRAMREGDEFITLESTSRSVLHARETLDRHSVRSASRRMTRASSRNSPWGKLLRYSSTSCRAAARSPSARRFRARSKRSISCRIENFGDFDCDGAATDFAGALTARGLALAVVGGSTSGRTVTAAGADTAAVGASAELPFTTAFAAPPSLGAGTSLKPTASAGPPMLITSAALVNQAFQRRAFPGARAAGSAVVVARALGSGATPMSPSADSARWRTSGGVVSAAAAPSIARSRGKSLVSMSLRSTTADLPERLLQRRGVCAYLFSSATETRVRSALWDLEELRYLRAPQALDFK